MLAEEILVEARSPDGYSVEEDGGMLVALDVRLTPELRTEGLARHLVRHIQNTRKAANLNVSDTIVTTLSLDGPLAEAARAYEGYLRQETLSTELHFGDPPSGSFTADFVIDGEKGRVSVRKSNGKP